MGLVFQFIIFSLFFIGQIEGGFVFSLGFWMTEQIKHDPITGQLLTNDTWVRQTGLKFRKNSGIYKIVEKSPKTHWFYPFFGIYCTIFYF